MKKFILSGVVVVAFVFYVMLQNLGDKVNTNTPTIDTNSETFNSTPSSPPVSGPTPVPNQKPTPVPPSPTTNAGQYKNGQYTGSVADAYYGNIQVKVIIINGAISDVQFLQYPNDRSTSIYINTQAMPYLKTEAIQAQSANVNIVSGATDSSLAFRQSLGAALAQAIN